MRNIDLSELPLLSKDGRICWEKSIGQTIHFIYDDKQGYLEILNYKTDGNCPEILIRYQNQEQWTKAVNLKHCSIGKIVKAKPKYNPIINNLVGQKFGKLSVLEDSGQRTDLGQILWKCQCDCGHITYVIGTRLKSGHTTSCGCKAQRYFNRKQTSNKEKEKSAITRIIGRYKAKAKERNIKWMLSRDDFINISEKPCFYCVISSSMNLNINGYIYLYNGVDRVDSQKDYTPDNIVPCCKQCNIAKSDMSLTEFYQWLNRISNHISQNELIQET